MSSYQVERLAPGFRDVRTFNTKAKAIAYSQNVMVPTAHGEAVRADVSIRRIPQHG